MNPWEFAAYLGREHPWWVVGIVIGLAWVMPWARSYRRQRLLEQAALCNGVCPDCGGTKVGDSFWEVGRFRHRLDFQCLTCYSRYPMPKEAVRRRVRDALADQVDKNVDEILRGRR